MAAVRHIRNLKNRHNSTATWAPILGDQGQLTPTFRSGGQLGVTFIRSFRWILPFGCPNLPGRRWHDNIDVNPRPE